MTTSPALWRGISIYLVALAIGAGPALAQSVIVVPSAPPAVREEIIPPAPSQTVTWQPGYWRWDGAQYDWVAGHYEARPTNVTVWVTGRWIQQPSGWVWQEGHWE